jgi:hypothetical protein
MEDFDWIIDSDFDSDVEKLEHYLLTTPLKLTTYGTDEIDFEERDDTVRDRLDIKGGGMLQLYIDTKGNLVSGDGDKLKNYIINWDRTVDGINKFQNPQAAVHTIEMYRILYDTLVKLFPDIFHFGSL